MNHEESNLQIHCVELFRWLHPNLAQLLFSVPNGGRRDKVTGAILKREGATPGVSDLILFVANSKYHGLCIEMKTPTGRQSPSQKEWQRQVEAQGYKYIVVRTIEGFQHDVEAYLKG